MSLEDIFGFDSKEFDSNAKGQLTPHQLEKLQSHRKISGCGTGVALLAILVTAGVLGGIILSNADFDTSAMQQALPYIGAVLGFVTVVFVLFWLLGIYRARHLRSQNVSEVSGKARPQIKSRQYHKEFYVTIGKVRFQVNTITEHDAFSPDKSYRVYYVDYPPTHIILSVMPLAD